MPVCCDVYLKTSAVLSSRKGIFLKRGKFIKGEIRGLESCSVSGESVRW